MCHVQKPALISRSQFKVRGQYSWVEKQCTLAVSSTSPDYHKVTCLTVHDATLQNARTTTVSGVSM